MWYCIVHFIGHIMKRYLTHSLGSMLLATLLSFVPGVLHAQNGAKVYEGAEAARQVPKARYVRINSNTRFPARVTFQDDQPVRRQNFTSWFRTTFKASSDLDLRSLKSNQDDLGNTHYRYVQTYQGIPVDMTWLIVHTKGDQVYSFNGHMVDVNPLSTTAGISEEQALTIAKQIVGAARYKWEDPKEEEMLKERTNDPNATYFPQGELLFVHESGDVRPASGNYVLAWKFDIHEVSSVLDQTIYIHAGTGQVIKSIPLVINCDPGTAATTWNGSQTIQTDYVPGDNNYILLDDCPGHGTIRTVQEAGLADYTDADNVWNAAGQTGPATTHYHARKTMDYFQTIHSRNSYDNAGAGIQLRHRANTANAYYAGAGVIIIGADALDANYYNTLDVVAHEFTHGVIDFEANLVYQGEPGALNESFADILGETCERWAENNMNVDWLHREDYYNGNNRSFINPNDKNDPDTYDGTYWAPTCNGCGDAGGVHTNSGVQNHWFYLLTVGKNGTNDNGDNYSVSGIGLVKARTITYDNLTNELGVNSDYADARDGAIAAAEARYGICSNEVLQVKNAWFAVGVGADGQAINGLEGKSITFSPDYCQEDPGPVIGLNSSDAKHNYQLKTIGGANLGSPVPGTGSAIYFGIYPNGTYKVVVTDASCTGSITATSSSTRGNCTVTVPSFCSSCGDGNQIPVSLKTNAPAGQTWTVKARTGLYLPFNPYPLVPLNTPLPYIGGNMYKLDASRASDKGFWVKVTNGFTDLDVMVGNPW
ncbi:MAG: peptidase M4 family protein [Bacteroidetes bacterium]|nr:MAG: peptidase M4 family protein [Bacteroidota bacterium]